MTDRAQSLTDLSATLGALLGLDIKPEWQPKVQSFLVMLAAAADQYVHLPLDDAHDEAAPVFRPGPPLAVPTPDKIDNAP